MEPKPTPEELGVIEDVSVSTKRYISQRWGNGFYVAGGVLILGGFFFPPFWFVALLWFVIGFAIARSKVYTEFFKQFATNNHFVYEEKGDLGSVEGTLFGRGHTRGMSHVVSGVQQALPIRFFVYHYTEGQGKSQSTHQFTVAELVFGGSLPDIIVDSKDDMYVDGGFFSKFKSLELGNGFDDVFTLKVPEDLEIEALEVFTPEIMEQLMSRGRGYSFEFIGTKLYVWKPGVARTSTQLREHLSLAQYFITALAPRLARLSDDVEAYRSARS